MRITICSFMLLIMALSGASADDSKVQAEVKLFFDQYVELSDAFDPKIADLYSDSAMIRAYRRYPNGLNKEMELSGVQWKSLIGKVMPLAKARGDRNTFTGITISIDGIRAKIKADRYSILKCYTDKGYYMIVEQQSEGKYLIVEEYMETQPGSDC